MTAVIDASNHIAGRLATHVAKRLLEGEEIHIIHAENVVITGSEPSIVAETRANYLRGSVARGPYYPKRPDRILKRIIRGMVPYRKPRGRTAMKRLRVYVGVPRELKDEKPQTVDAAIMRSDSPYVLLGQVSKKLGSEF